MIKFGVARKYAKDIREYVNELIQNHIDAYEMGFAYGIPEKVPKEVIDLSKKQGFILSCHLPFWINLGNSNNEKNIDYIVRGLNIAEQLNSVAVFHLGFYGKKKWNKIKYKARDVIRRALELSRIKKAKLGIETTGKQQAIETIEEIIELINFIDNKRVIPIIDWSHVYARNNGFYPYRYDDFVEILERFERELGYKPFYFHGGGIEYKNGNEIKHVTAKKLDPPLPYLYAALKEFDYKNIIFIVESPDSIEDIKFLKEVWRTPELYFDRIPSKKQLSLFEYG